MANLPIEIPGPRYFEKLISCREACPVHTDARGYVQAVAQGDYALAYRIARAPNPFASICGRVCGAPCEAACRRGDIDAPVAIRAIKRTTTERHGVEVGGDPKESLIFSTAPGSLEPEQLPHKVAIVGAGVGGLTAAHDLARVGVQCTVFEAGAKPGGMLRTGVPIFRLPEKVWSTEIDAILSLGVELKCNTRVGTDVTLEELKAQGYEAVILAVGLQKSRMLDLPGKELEGIIPGLEILEEFNDRKPREGLGRVVVIGGGNVAYDCARSAIRMKGTTEVSMVILESLEEMPADEIEIIEGDEEGIVRLNRHGPVRFVGEDGKVTGLETRKVSRVFDEEGRFAPVLVDGSEEIVPCDTIIVAIGQASDTGFANGVEELELGRGGVVVADRETGATSIPWIYAVGDVALGPGLFINAIAHGQKAAKLVFRQLVGEEKAEEILRQPKTFGFLTEKIREGLRQDYLHLNRAFPPAADPGERLGQMDLQVEHMYDDREARLQGSRCLRCEVETVFDGAKCILCGGCADVCPTWCLKLVDTESIGLGDQFPGKSAIIKDEDRCIRCGYCAERCPTDAITMERLVGFEEWTDQPLVQLGKVRGA